MAHDDDPTFKPPAAVKTARGYRSVLRTSTGAFLTADERRVPETIQLDRRWRFYTLQLVDPGARLVKDVPWACEGLPCTGDQLKQARDRLGEVEAAQSAAQREADELGRVAVFYRNQITDWTATIGATADAKEADPTVDKPRKDEVRVAAGPFRAVVAHYGEQQSAAARATLQLKQESRVTAQAMQQKDLELRALRGERLGPADLQPPPAPRSRRRGRR